MSDKIPRGTSLCMLAHKMEVEPFGEQGLLMFLEHASLNVEEINLVDTSIYNDLQEQLNGKVPENVTMHRTPHDLGNFSFSDNRNYSLSLARYSWILVLDPDERIDSWGAIRKQVKRDDDQVFYLMGSGKTDFPEGAITSRMTGMPRLFKNNKGHNFRKKVYEELHDADGRSLQLQGLTLLCGYVHATTEKRKQKNEELYLELMRNDTHENKRLYFNIVLEPK